MATVSAPSMQQQATGRGLFWAGLALCVLPIAACMLQYMMKQLFMPWYLPILTTLGVLLLFFATAQRRTLPRIIVLILLTALAGFEWLFFLAFSRLPAYDGPARVGQPIPAFETTLADGSSFTDKDLQRDMPTVMVFFRGRW